jgi:carbonic anhydrase/acetyltransferase-like protein (isoleucine patch superfamily)
MIIPYKGIAPKIHPSCFIAPSADIIGDVTIGEGSNIWFNCTIRGDVAAVRIGANTNVQDGSVIHVTRDGFPTTIEDNSFVGMGSMVLDCAIIESNAMLAAGSMLTKDKIVKAGELWAGRPAKFFRLLTEEEISCIQASAQNYSKLAGEYGNL